MIVTCPQCSTRFNLDESLITKEAAKVRCSQCRHVFTITRPGEPEFPPDRTPREEPAAPPEPEAPAGEPVATPASQPEPDLATSGALGESPTQVTEEAVLPPEPDAPPLIAASRQPGKAWRAALVAILGGCLLGLLLGVLALWYLGGKRPGPPTGQTAAGPAGETLTVPLPPASPEDLRNLRVGLQDARYQGLVNAKGEQLLVIQGEVINNTGEPRGPIRLKAALTDSLNQPVQELLFYSGTSLSEEEVLKTDPEQIKRWLATPGGRLQRVLKPGASQPFTAVFFGVPDNLAEARFGFTVVVVDGPRVSTE
jgi:predicted Zn finger-like uncharacterized protein